MDWPLSKLNCNVSRIIIDLVSIPSEPKNSIDRKDLFKRNFRIQIRQYSHPLNLNNNEKLRILPKSILEFPLLILNHYNQSMAEDDYELLDHLTETLPHIHDEL